MALTISGNIRSAHFSEFLGEHAVLSAGGFVKKVVCKQVEYTLWDCTNTSEILCLFFLAVSS